MAILQNRRTVFSLSNSEVMSNSAPTTEAGITKSEGHDGFFIYSDKAFTLWFKDQGGSWSSYNTYNSVDLSDGVAFSWGDNTAAFIQTNEVAHSIAVFIIETKEVGQYKNVENRTLNEAGFGRLDIHSNYKRVRMQNSGHTGEAYAIAIFDENGEAAYVSAPPSGQREGKALGWDENGNLGWITLAAAQESSNSLPTPDLYLDGSSTTSQIGNNTIALGGAILSTNGKYDSNAFSFGASGNKAPIRIGTDLDLSTGVYTFSLWFYNVRSGTDWKSVFRRTSGPSPVNTAQYPILIAPTTNELSLLTESLANGGSFNSTGYDMSSFVGNNTWNHLAVVADGTNSTFYVNGSQAGSVVNEVITTSVGEIGAYDGNDTQVFAQALDEIAYWDSALTADQISEIYNSSVKLGGLVTEAPASQNLEESAGATYVADAVVTNGILDLDGTGDYVSIPHDVAYERETGDMSVMLWFKPRAIGYLSTLISKTTGYSSWEGWIIQVTEDDLSATDLNGNSMTNGGFRFFNSQGSNDIKYLAPTGGISLNQWHHMTMVMKASGAYEFYYDGSLLGSFTPSSKSTSNNVPLIIGANKDGGSQPAYNRMFNGMIDDVIIVKEALTSDQIAAAYNAGLNSGTYDAVISELASVANAQSNGTLGQGATVVNGMYINPNTRGQGYVQGTWTNDMRPDNSADDFSFSGYWRIKTANDNDRGWLFGREGSVSAGGWGIFLKKRTATTVAYEIVMSGGNPTFITDDITTNVFDEFHHVSFTYSNGEWKFYHDGTLVYTKTGVNMPTTNPSGGKYKLGNGWAVMALDEINLFKGTYLSTSQITSLAGERSQKDTDYTNNT